MNGQFRTIPAVEFLQSGLVSNGIFLLQHEERTSTQADAETPTGRAGQVANAHGAGNNGSIHNIGNGKPQSQSQAQQRRQFFENTVRLALLITRRFIMFRNLFGSNRDDNDDDVPYYLSYIQLEDFFVKCKFHHSHSSSSSSAHDLSLSMHNEDQLQKLFSWFDGKDAAYQDCHAKYPSFDSSDDSLQKLITLLTVEIVFADHDNSRSQQQQHHQDQDQRPSKQTAIQVLGNLLYSVFSQGKSRPSDLFTIDTETFPLLSQAQEIAAALAFDSDSIDGPSSSKKKTLRRTEVSVFSKLVESGMFPISICRFLSDMIDTSSNKGSKGKGKGKADSPFTSFEHVIQDLEQMISQPETFLHDEMHHRGLRTPLFGQLHHGQNEEVASLKRIATQIMQTEQASSIQAVYVSGIAGSGKSFLVQTVADHLVSLGGWFVIKAKFERSTVHASRGILSSMFDQVISHLVKMKTPGGDLSDVYHSIRASKFILDAIGYEGLSLLVDFLPSLPILFDGVGVGVGNMNMNKRFMAEKTINDQQLSYSLSKILQAVFESDLRVMIFCDDLQWADTTSLALISKVLITVGGFKPTSQHCLFVGSYRVNEVDANHPFSIQCGNLEMNSNVNTTKITIPSLSKEDIIGMTMAGLRLPRRLVANLAGLVRKKTSGHALFVVELLNSLLRDSTIAYSPQKLRYVWDPDMLNFIQTGDSVAGLIASNLTSLPPASKRILQILSCFGMQTEISLLEILEKCFQQRIVYSLETFIASGILDRAGPIVIFVHDLIQQEVYEGMTVDQRRALHLEIGQFLGALASSTDIDAATTMQTVEPRTNLIDIGQTLTSSLISTACGQVNAVGPDAIDNESLRTKFAEWNLLAGQKTSHESALYYFSNGISLLGKVWRNDLSLLFLELYKGVVLTSFMLGEAEDVIQYGQMVLEQQELKIEDTLEVQQAVLKSLAQMGNHKECICNSIDLLRQLNFDIPLSPTKDTLINAMKDTDILASKYSVDQIITLCDKVVDDSAHNIVKIMDAAYLSCYTSVSTFLPLIVFEIVKYSCINGVCQESSTAFASFGMFTIFFHGDYSGGRKWADVARKVMKKFQAPNKNLSHANRAHLLLYATVDIWFTSPREISRNLITYHHDAMEKGQIDLAEISLMMGVRYLILGGGSLSMVYKKSEERLGLMSKHSNYAAKYAILDNILLFELMGKSEDHFSLLDGSICSICDLQAEAESTHDTRLLHNIHCYNTLIEYWREDYLAAEKSSHMAFALPAADMPQIRLIYNTFFSGLIAFKLYRKVGGDQRLEEGIKRMKDYEKWAQNSMAVFENKWLLLKAEYIASICESVASIHGHDEALQLYQASINASKDHGNIHELALAFELLGNYYSAQGCVKDSLDCFKNAHLYYTQWGASSVAEKVLRKCKMDKNSTNLSASSGCAIILDSNTKCGIKVRNTKHSRQLD